MAKAPTVQTSSDKSPASHRRLGGVKSGYGLRLQPRVTAK